MRSSWAPQLPNQTARPRHEQPAGIGGRATACSRKTRPSGSRATATKFPCTSKPMPHPPLARSAGAWTVAMQAASAAPETLSKRSSGILHEVLGYTTPIKQSQWPWPTMQWGHTRVPSGTMGVPACHRRVRASTTAEAPDQPARPRCRQPACTRSRATACCRDLWPSGRRATTIGSPCSSKLLLYLPYGRRVQALWSRRRP